MKQLLFLVISLLLISSSIIYLKKDSSVKNTEESFTFYQLNINEKNKLREGDIILRKGYGFVSNIISTLLKEPKDVTHIGILLKENKQWKVAHVLSSTVSNQEGIRLQNLDSFVNYSKKNSILISRLKNITSTQQIQIKKQTYHYLNKKILFDHAFDYKDSTNFYCSELIWRIFEQNLKYLKITDSISFNEKYHTLKTFYNTKYFDLIINHHQ